MGWGKLKRLKREVFLRCEKNKEIQCVYEAEVSVQLLFPRSTLKGAAVACLRLRRQHVTADLLKVERGK